METGKIGENLSKMSRSDYQRLYLRRAERVAQLLAGLPFIRLVGLNGSLARGEAAEQSDIDYLIITAPGRLYTVRLLVTSFVHLLGLRRYGRLIAGRICLNHYQTADQLTIEPRNRYSAEIFSQLIPLVDLDNTYRRYQVVNEWMAQFGQPVRSPGRRRPSRSLLFSQLTRRLGEWLLVGWWGDRLEALAKTYQQRKIARNPLTRRYPDRINVSDNRLLFHPLPPSPAELDAQERD